MLDIRSLYGMPKSLLKQTEIACIKEGSDVNGNKILRFNNQIFMTSKALITSYIYLEFKSVLKKY